MDNNFNPTVVVQLKGGLGNQMFQYAAARGLAKRSGAGLVIDHVGGFARDFEFNRHFELSSLPIEGKRSSFLDRSPAWLFRVHRFASPRISRICPGGLRRLRCRSADGSPVREYKEWYGRFIVEERPEVCRELLCPTLTSCWLFGYWQAYDYFKDVADTVRRELTPPLPTCKRYLDLGKRLRDSQTIAVGIRLYEEAKAPELMSATGRSKEIGVASKALHAVLRAHPHLKVAVFCTHRSAALADLRLPSDTMFITGDDGFSDSVSTLWLLAACRHHFFFNSTYFWWGAWLSSSYYQKFGASQLIFAADNFLNRGAYLEGWHTF